VTARKTPPTSGKETLLVIKADVGDRDLTPPASRRTIIDEFVTLNSERTPLAANDKGKERDDPSGDFVAISLEEFDEVDRLPELPVKQELTIPFMERVPRNVDASERRPVQAQVKQNPQSAREKADGRKAPMPHVDVMPEPQVSEPEVVPNGTPDPKPASSTTKRRKPIKHTCSICGWSRVSEDRARTVLAQHDCPGARKVKNKVGGKRAGDMEMAKALNEEHAKIEGAFDALKEKAQEVVDVSVDYARLERENQDYKKIIDAIPLVDNSPSYDTFDRSYMEYLGESAKDTHAAILRRMFFVRHQPSSLLDARAKSLAGSKMEFSDPRLFTVRDVTTYYEFRAGELDPNRAHLELERNAAPEAFFARFKESFSEKPIDTVVSAELITQIATHANLTDLFDDATVAVRLNNAAKSISAVNLDRYDSFQMPVSQDSANFAFFLWKLQQHKHKDSHFPRAPTVAGSPMAIGSERFLYLKSHLSRLVLRSKFNEPPMSRFEARFSSALDVTTKALVVLAQILLTLLVVSSVLPSELQQPLQSLILLPSRSLLFLLGIGSKPFWIHCLLLKTLPFLLGLLRRITRYGVALIYNQPLIKTFLHSLLNWEEEIAAAFLTAVTTPVREWKNLSSKMIVQMVVLGGIVLAMSLIVALTYFAESPEGPFGGTIPVAMELTKRHIEEQINNTNSWLMDNVPDVSIHSLNIAYRNALLRMSPMMNISTLAEYFREQTTSNVQSDPLLEQLKNLSSKTDISSNTFLYESARLSSQLYNALAQGMRQLITHLLKVCSAES
jgi:hypothetical protein